LLTDETANVGGVAYMAHIGGFFAGLILTFVFRGTQSSQTTV
jgi:membrane associated rhomboid family serine protease